jgi:hypothetical protein
MYNECLQLAQSEDTKEFGKRPDNCVSRPCPAGMLDRSLQGCIYGVSALQLAVPFESKLSGPLVFLAITAFGTTLTSLSAGQCSEMSEM